MTEPDGPVSAEVSRSVPAGKAVRFEELLREVIMVARGFPGHLGVDVLRPEGGGTYRIVFRFRSRADYRLWTDSDQRRLLVDGIDALLDDGAAAVTRTVDGWEGWFVTPGYAPPTPPRRWKMALITLAGVYPIVLLLLTVLQPLTGGWPLALGMLLTMSLSMALMTWVVMPTLTTRLGPWLRR